jgi:DNA-binding PadR family transcriptional regulator
MADDIRLSPQTLSLLEALCESPLRWHYGYDLSRRTQLKSGTLYPILIRLADSGWLETKWEHAEENGKPRHLYRLTAEGRHKARATLRESELPELTIRPLRPHPARQS